MAKHKLDQDAISNKKAARVALQKEKGKVTSMTAVSSRLELIEIILGLK
jgi:hypothetical protein